MLETQNKQTFKGSEFIRAAKGSEQDVLTAILEKDKLYTEENVKKLVKIFNNKEVKQ